MSLTREPGRWKRAGNRERKMVSEPRGRSARALSLRRVRPLKRPAVRRVSRAQLPLPQLQGRTCEGAVNQGGTTEVSSSRPCRASARKDGSFFAWHCQAPSRSGTGCWPRQLGLCLVQRAPRRSGGKCSPPPPGLMGGADGHIAHFADSAVPALAKIPLVRI